METARILKLPWNDLFPGEIGLLREGWILSDQRKTGRFTAIRTRALCRHGIAPIEAGGICRPGSI